MNTRRIRRAPPADTQGLTDADRKAIRTYRMTRRTANYYRDLDDIDSGPNMAKTEKTTDQGSTE
jgi:hypothetical protein